jgi:hypothetical protein
MILEGQGEHLLVEVDRQTGLRDRVAHSRILQEVARKFQQVDRSPLKWTGKTSALSSLGRPLESRTYPYDITWEPRKTNVFRY